MHMATFGGVVGFRFCFFFFLRKTQWGPGCSEGTSHSPGWGGGGNWYYHHEGGAQQPQPLTKPDTLHKPDSSTPEDSS